jgi:LysM repeat protein
VHEPSYLFTKKKSFYYQRDAKPVQLTKYYTIRKGDNLGAIAARNGTSVNSICRLNSLKTNSTLKPGQRLRVR